LTLFNACQPEIEYREVIKEVPVEVQVEVPVKVPYEVPVKVPVEVPVKVPVEVPVYDESRINELIAQIEELQSSYETQLSELNEEYNSKLEELLSSDTSNELLLQQIKELEENQKSQIEELNITYNSKISELEELISSLTTGEICEIRVHKVYDKDKSYKTPTTDTAIEYYCAYVRHSWYYVPEEVTIVHDTDNQLEIAIAESQYVNCDIDTIRKDMEENQISYGFYWEGDYIILWFVVWLFYQYP